ncbi:MAG TPA: M67 family metallopeptidase, partial [Candidatus Bathyarchaeia archaeon]|nr:M67 family metallopeptidase [Candidatus Bathyarchaeia archaeon]
ETIILPNVILSKLVTHANNSKPYESVALIAGKIQGSIAFAEKAYTPRNIEQSTVSFSVEPLELLEIYTDIENEKLELVAIFHTHPAPPTPSGTDLYYMEVNTCIWLISNTAEPEKPHGFLLLEDGSLKKIKIEITNNKPNLV